MKFLVIFISGVLAILVEADNDNGGCWRPTYGRGVGVPISVCPDGLEDDAALCYTPCKYGFYGFGPVCWETCPNGFTDMGLGCTKPAPYGRGWGSFTESSCESDGDSCEKWGLLWYPKCKNGFHNVACCICSPDCPDGFTDAGEFCTKQSYGRGVGTPLTCAPGLQWDAALCYNYCGDKYNGVGPICWHECPEDKYSCGALCLESEAECIKDMFNIAQEVAIAAAEIASAPEDAPGVIIETAAKLAPELNKPLCSNVS